MMPAEVKLRIEESSGQFWVTVTYSGLPVAPNGRTDAEAPESRERVESLVRATLPLAVMAARTMLWNLSQYGRPLLRAGEVRAKEK